MYGTPNPTCSTSAAMVPNTPTMTTASQYVHAMYRRTENCRTRAATKNTKPRPTAATGLMAWTR